jgi:hypothetical protein
MRPAALLAAGGVLLCSGPARAEGPVVRVPRGTSVLVDGKMEEVEWARAATRPLPGGGVLRLQHDGRHLFLGIESGRQGFPSVCVAAADTVHVRHASAALGSVTYTRSGEGWTTRDLEFTYGMRNPDLGEEARAERRQYLERHGWLASTFRMGDGRVQELQIPRDVFPPGSRLGIGYFVTGPGDQGSVVAWPTSMPAGDGCADEPLVRGHVPKRLRFQPREWAALDWAP